MNKLIFPCKPDKSPLTARGFKDATDDPFKILMWEDEHPGCLWGMPTGAASGVFVLDVDVHGVDGYASLAALTAEHGELPRTRAVDTLSGGRHYYFAYPESAQVRNSAGKVAPGLDIRGDGGYVIIPHGDNCPYTLCDAAPVADAPQWLIAAATSRVEATARTGDADADTGVYPAGTRNDKLMRLAGSLHSKGLTLPAVVAALLEENRARCNPPLPEKEVEGIARNIAKLDRNGRQPAEPIEKTFAEKFAPVYAEWGEPADIVQLKNGVSVTPNEFWFAAAYAHDRDVLYDADMGSFYEYEPGTGLWTPKTGSRVCLDLGQLVIRAAKGIKQPKLVKAARTQARCEAMRRLAMGTCEEPDAFSADNRGNLIHVANGMLDIESDPSKILPFAPKYRSRNRSPVSYNDRMLAAGWVEMLDRTMSDADAVLLQKYAGQCILGRNLSQTILLLTGVAGTSKSTIVSVLEKIVGHHNVEELRTEHLNKQFELYRYIGKTLVTGKDVPGKFLSTVGASKLKALCGGDRLSAEGKNSNATFSITGDFNIIITSNSRLHVRMDSDAGAWRRRLCYIDIEAQPVTKRIPHYDDHLVETEGPGILAWMLDGVRMLLADIAEHGKLRLTEDQVERVDNLLNESDTVRQFVTQNVSRRESPAAEDNDEEDRQNDRGVTVSEMWEAYRDYCDADGLEAKSRGQFGREIGSIMLEVHALAHRNDILRYDKHQRGYKNCHIEAAIL